MPLQDSYACLVVKAVPTDTATTDGASVDVPFTGSGYVVRAVHVYNSRILSTGATADNSTATLGVFGASGGSSPTIVANAALTTHTGKTIVSSRTVAATATTPIVTASTLYIRTGTASGVTGSGVDVVIEYSALP
jgi:hypothetical protein